ncbi:hypothetical protein NESM_000772700 [Novymonas esmeraldas]|uniref:Uncharacterized protein n=1 Tax=Novymonas esmeraldas TaxID=1808958 RepID=A0AAW0EV77_9TRYP
MQDLAQRFEQQGIRCSEDGSQRLWCSFCTEYNESTANRNDVHCAGSDPAHLSSPPGRSPCDRDAPDSRRPSIPASSSVCTMEATMAAVLAHCATRTHLHLYEHHVQHGLQHWCPVEMHSYRMLLNHHCIYPARMFGAGRLIMDASISGGMLLGVDVCGGVKLWPQHRYTAVEFILPSARCGVRELLVPPPPAPRAEESQSHEEAEEAGSRGQHAPPPPPLPPPPTQSGHPLAGRVVRILHETSEITPDTAYSYRCDSAASRRRRRDTSDKYGEETVLEADGKVNAMAVPRYTDLFHRLRSHRVRMGSLATVLNATNASIIGESRLRRQRRCYVLTHSNGATTDAADTDDATTDSGSDE